MSKYNPFNPNSTVMPTLFAGRVDQVYAICRKLEHISKGMPSSFFIYGEKGIGKTALAKLILYISSLKDPQCHNLNLLTSYYSVEKGQNFERVLQESLNKLTDKMDKNVLDTLGSKLGGLLKNGKFQIGAFGVNLALESLGGEEQEKQKEVIIKDQATSILSNIITSITTGDSTVSRDGILIVIDETHNLKNIETASSILRNIITTLDVDGSGKISFLLLGYKEDMERFFSEDSSSRRSFDLVELGIMPKNEAAEILTKGFNEASIKWDDDSLKLNIGAAGGYPHSIQILGHKLVEVDADNFIDGKDWIAAITSTAAELRSKDFSQMYSFNKPLTVKDEVLALLADVNKPLSKKEISEGVIGKNIYQSIPALKKSGAVKETPDKKIELHSQLFRTAIIIDQFIREQEDLKK